MYKILTLIHLKFKKDLIKKIQNTKYTQFAKALKNPKYVKTIKMYKILTLPHFKLRRLRLKIWKGTACHQCNSFD